MHECSAVADDRLVLAVGRTTLGIAKSRILLQPVDGAARNPPGSADSRPPNCIPTYRRHM